MDFKDWAIKVGIRTLRTFIQAFLGILTASGTGMVGMDVLTNALVRELLLLLRLYRMAWKSGHQKIKAKFF